MANGTQKHRYHLVYFDIKGRGEPIRLLFHYFSVPFQDDRVDAEEWPDRKEKAPMRQLPFLEVDGGKLVLCQTGAILRFLAKTFRPGFAGRSKSESAYVDMYAEGALDLFAVFGAVAMAKSDEDKLEAIESIKERLLVFLSVYSGHLKKNGNRFIVGDHLTWADLVVVFVLSAIDDIAPDLLGEYNSLIRYYYRVRELDEIEEYVRSNWIAPNVQKPEDD